MTVWTDFVLTMGYLFIMFLLLVFAGLAAKRRQDKRNGV